ncbi:MAG TPA: sigma-70 family RNA polymerase sigma factor [Acidimicrobiales bacterium]|nr:sigma-70 family RNA polymerase sigma factor [Acidimicrobiales bacterium]
MTIAATPLEHSPTEPTSSSPVGTDSTNAGSEAADITEQVRAFADGEYRQVVATVAMWSNSIDDAADAVADALGRAWEKCDRGESIDNLAAFVTTTAMNQVRSAHRRAELFRRKRHLLAVVDTWESTESAVRRLDTARAMRGLTRRQQEVVALRYGVDLSIGEIADRLGVAPGTIKATLHQARSLLADRLDAPTKGEGDD